jgi:undecaprenyl-diphosphatase
VALFSLAAVLVIVVPVVVRFSGLGDADVAITNWARSQWTSDGYLFALDAATFADPGVLFAVAAVVSVGRWWWMRRRAGGGGGLLAAVGPVLPIVLLAAAYSWATPPAWEAWQTPRSVVFPGVGEFDGYIPFDVAGVMASRAVGHTAQLAGAVGLLTWLLAGRLPWKWRVTVWTGAAIYVTTCAGSWVYLGWSRTSEAVAAVLVGATWAALNAAVWSAPHARPAPEATALEPAAA